MSRLVVRTAPIGDYLREGYNKYSRQGDILAEYLTILKRARKVLAPEDLAVVDYEISTLEKKAAHYIDDIFPQLHQLPIATKPIEPYEEAVSRIQQFVYDHQIPTFITEINKIHPINRTRAPEGVGEFGEDGLEVEAVDGEGEVDDASLLESILAGIWDGVKNVLIDTWEGLIALFDPDTWRAIAEALADPIATLENIWETISDSFQEMVIDGDARSRAEWFTYAVGTVVASVIGTKGADKVAAATKLVTKSTKLPELASKAKVKTGIAKQKVAHHVRKSLEQSRQKFGELKHAICDLKNSRRFVTPDGQVYRISPRDVDPPNPSRSNTRKRGRNKPKEYGIPDSTEVIWDKSGKIIKYITYGSDGKIIKEVRIVGKDHGSIPRPNVKEPNYNINPITGEKFQNDYKVRAVRPDELPRNIRK
ncbi:polymorphic toxin type 24 domain-containing protein [Numidum massiliense]|uniref:polymorphic toxin type 24 domain-containing protein n=1 Tax=Numidum massiliense TaxID=1522315 RepID=UPI0006D59B73|nr:polymorphic toxin type 24 domain-containing protein [Numidum massiliense]